MSLRHRVDAAADGRPGELTIGIGSIDAVAADAIGLFERKVGEHADDERCVVC